MGHIFWVLLKYTFMAISPLSIYSNWCNPKGRFFWGGGEHIYIYMYTYTYIDMIYVCISYVFIHMMFWCQPTFGAEAAARQRQRLRGLPRGPALCGVRSGRRGLGPRRRKLKKSQEKHRKSCDHLFVLTLVTLKSWTCSHQFLVFYRFWWTAFSCQWRRIHVYGLARNDTA